MPLPHTSCKEYLTVTTNDRTVRASHQCPSKAPCFDTRSCTCRRCQHVVCNRIPLTANLTIDVYGYDPEPAGKLSWTRVKQPGLTVGYSLSSNKDGDLNPRRLPGRPVYKSPTASQTTGRSLLLKNSWVLNCMFVSLIGLILIISTELN